MPRIEKYEGASQWPFVVLVIAFIAAYIVVGWLELPAAVQSAITGLAGVALGGVGTRTYKPVSR